MCSLFARFRSSSQGEISGQVRLESKLSFERAQQDKDFLLHVIELGKLNTEVQEFLAQCLTRDFESPVLLTEELALLSRLIELAKALFDVHIKADIALLDSDFIIEPFVLFPLFQHALRSIYFNSEKKPIRIKVKLVNRVLELSVSNQINPYVAGQSQSSSMLFFRSRLVYHYPDKHHLFFNSNSNIHKAMLHLHL